MYKSRRFQENPGERGSRGRIVEEEVLGAPIETISHKEFLNSGHYREHTPEEWFDHVRAIQPNKKREFESGLVLEVSPRSPQKYFTKRLREGVIERLNLPEEFQDNLHFNTAVNTVVDYAYGVDAFVDLIIDEEKIITVTLDVTVNSRKEKGKADVVFTYGDYDLKDERDKELFEEKVNEVADLVSYHLGVRLSTADKEKLGLPKNEMEMYYDDPNGVYEEEDEEEYA